MGVKNKTNDFLKKYLKTKPGEIIDVKGKKIGKHNGLWFYTIGQRKGLEISQGSASVTQAERHSGETKPWFVVDKDFKKNVLVVSKNQKDLEKKELIAININWITPQKLPLNAEVKIRYKSNLSSALIRANKGGGVKVIFQKPQRAITSGQSVVFYKGGELLGGGVIDK